jgi:hypothetical protein
MLMEINRRQRNGNYGMSFAQFYAKICWGIQITIACLRVRCVRARLWTKFGIFV